MQWKSPKNTDKYFWTQHVVGKMHQYGLSEQKVLGVVRNPFRTETGIAPDTVAVMQPVGNIKKKTKTSKWSRTVDDDGEESWNQEIWVLYQTKTQKAKTKITATNDALRELQRKINTPSKITIISAWRYPGVSPEKNPIPEEILREIEELGLE